MVIYLAGGILGNNRALWKDAAAGIGGGTKFLNRITIAETTRGLTG